jgi:hypothetical protein
MQDAANYSVAAPARVLHRGRQPISGTRLRSARDGILGIILVAPFVLILFGVHHFYGMHENLPKAAVPDISSRHHWLGPERRDHSVGVTDDKQSGSSLPGNGRILPRYNRTAFELFLATLFVAHGNEEDTGRILDAGIVSGREFQPTRRPNIIVLDSWGDSLAAFSQTPRFGGTLSHRDGSLGSLPRSLGTFLPRAKRTDKGEGLKVEEALVALGWKSISELVAGLSEGYFMDGIFPFIESLSRSGESDEPLSPADALIDIDHSRYPLVRAAGILFNGTRHGDKMEPEPRKMNGDDTSAWVLYDPRAAFVLHIWQFLLSEHSYSNTLLIFLHDTNFQPKMASLDWNPVGFSAVWAYRTWSKWQFEKFKGQKFKFTNGEWNRMKNMLSPYATSRVHSATDGLASHNSNSGIKLTGASSFKASFYRYREALGLANATVEYKGQLITVIFKGISSDPGAASLEDIPCPTFLTAPGGFPKQLQIEGIHSAKSEGKECALSCVNVNCTNVLEACHRTRECTHVAFADLRYSSATKVWGGPRNPQTESSSSSQYSRSPPLSWRARSYASTPFNYTEVPEVPLSPRNTQSVGANSMIAHSSRLFQRYHGASSSFGMKGALARLKHARSSKEQAEARSRAQKERRRKLDECLAHGSDPAYDRIEDMIKLHPRSDEALAEDEKLRVQRRVRERKAPVMFVHIHKAGGTTLCNLAKANHLTVPATYSPTSYKGIGGKNCNPSPLHLKAAWTGTVKEQRIYVRAMALDFYAHEKFLPPRMPFGDVAFVTIIRHPYDRLLSEGKHTGFKCLPTLQRSSMYSPSLSLPSSMSSFSTSPRYSATTVGSFGEFVECGEVNPIVRRFCGCLGTEDDGSGAGATTPQAAACGDASAEAIPDPLFRATIMTRRHLECAKRRLARFSVVMVTDMMFGGAGPLLLKQAFGWGSLLTEDMRGGTRRTSSALEEFKDEPETIKRLHQYHNLDLELYEHARALMCRALAKLRVGLGDGE